MQKWEWDVLLALAGESYKNQRILAEAAGCSLGAANQALARLLAEDFLNENMGLTEKAIGEIQRKKPRNAVILAAGYGMRMVPINMESHKAMLEVNGEALIERLISQLHAVGITEIYVIVGFLKERFEYLIDQYGVQLIVNTEYHRKNNLHSLRLAADRLTNTYVIPCDIWCRDNPFGDRELYSWYMVRDTMEQGSMVRVNRKNQLVRTGRGQAGNSMVGIAYLLEEQSAFLRRRLLEMDGQSSYDSSFWEEALFADDRMLVLGKLAAADSVVEINTFEQLRELDKNSAQLQSKVITQIADALGVQPPEISDLTVLKKGMTNRSFQFSCRGEKYIMRIPGEGTERLINREEEYRVYRAIGEKQLGDEVVYMDPHNGYKLSRFYPESRVCDPRNPEDLRRCMAKLREFHGYGLQVEHRFDLFAQILFYESLWKGQPSVFKDYEQTKEKVFSLKSYLDSREKELTLTHIDAVPDNFLFVKKPDGSEEIRLIDWEYAGMQDPHVDIAMFCIYSFFNRAQADALMDIYFQGHCDEDTRNKIYGYIAVCGLLWSNWCEFKRIEGVEFGEYSLRQYRYAKEFYKIVKERLGGAI